MTRGSPWIQRLQPPYCRWFHYWLMYKPVAFLTAQTFDPGTIMYSSQYPLSITLSSFFRADLLSWHVVTSHPSWWPDWGGLRLYLERKEESSCASDFLQIWENRVCGSPSIYRVTESVQVKIGKKGQVEFCCSKNTLLSYGLSTSRSAFWDVFFFFSPQHGCKMCLFDFP